MTHIAEGRFDITMKPESSTTEGVGRFAVSKIFHGDLEGDGSGEMLAARTAVAGSAAYVLIERITGTLGGHGGSFMLQHDGLMDRHAPSQKIVVIPDSGTGALEGISGTMTIDAAAGHSYVFRYVLPK